MFGKIYGLPLHTEDWDTDLWTSMEIYGHQEKFGDVQCRKKGAQK